MNNIKNIPPFLAIKINNSNPDYYKQYAKDNNYEFHELQNNREGMNLVGSLYRSNNRRILCFIANIDKCRGNVSDALLKLTEESREGFILVVTYTMLDEQNPLLQRAMKLYMDDNNSNSADLAVKQTIAYLNGKDTSKQTIVNMLNLSSKSTGTIDVNTYLHALADLYIDNLGSGNVTRIIIAENLIEISNTIRIINKNNNIFKEHEINKLLDVLKNV